MDSRRAKSNGYDALDHPAPPITTFVYRRPSSTHYEFLHTHPSLDVVVLVGS